LRADINITYSNRALFQAQLGASITDDYENPGYQFHQTDAQMTAVLNETRYQTTGFSNNDLVFLNNTHEYCAGCNGTFLLSFTQTTVGDSNGVSGVGLDVGINNGNPFYDALVTFGDGTTADYALPQGSPIVGQYVGFWGITSSAEIRSIYFGVDGNPSQSGLFSIDNLTIGGEASPVPEPRYLVVLMVFGIILGIARCAFVRQESTPSCTKS
jgi:hypothetical protein